MTATQPPEYVYEDEIDLRELILTLWRGKGVILLATVVAALAALGVSLALPKQYQAEADVVLTQPKLQIEAPQGFTVQVTVPDLKTAAALAQSPGVLQQLLEDPELGAVWKQEQEGNQPLTWQRLAGRVEVKEQGKNGLQLLFKDTDPQRAALVANHWAALVVDRINERYGWAGLSAQLDPQVQKAWEAYQQAQAAYLEEVSKNQATALQAQLERAKGDLSCLLSRSSQLDRLQKDVAAFSVYLGRLPASDALSPGDALALATLQQRVLALKACVSDTANPQAQWSADALAALTVGEAKGLTKGLGEVIRQRIEALPEQQKTLEGEIVRLKKALEEEGARLREVSQRRDLAWGTYQSLAARQAQISPLTSPENQVALLAAQAVAPEKPASPRTMLNVVLGGVLGAMLGILWVFGVAWWRDGEDEADKAKEKEDV